MDTVGKLILFAAVIVATVQISEACRCDPILTVSEAYCSQNISVKVLIEKTVQSNGMTYYSAKVEKPADMYKSNSAFRKILRASSSSSFLIDPLTGTTCARTFVIGSAYVVIGNIAPGLKIMIVSSCEYAKLFKNLSPDELKGFEGNDGFICPALC